MTITPTRACDCPEGRSFVSRRGFMALAGATGLVTATTVGGARVGLLPGADAADVDADILVVMSMRGGIDGLSVVVPHGDPDYAPSRPSIAIPTSRLKRVDNMFGLHPALAPLFGLWDSGKVAAVHAVGMPDPNRSHFAAMDQMEQAAPGSSLRTGWIDRTVGLIDTDVFTGGTFTASMVGTTTIPRSLSGPNPEFGMYSYDNVRLNMDESVAPLSAWQGSLASLHTGASPAVSRPTLKSFEAVGALRNGPAKGPGYPNGGPSAALRDIARLVKKQVGLRVATVDWGNWDMHEGLGSSQSGWMADQLTSLSTSLAAFAADLGNDFNRVTLVTLSEFGRRIDENGSGGVDHGYGNAVLLMGGGVRGGRVYGAWPGLADANRVDGDLAVRTDYRSIIAEVLSTRCRVGGVSSIFPGLRPTTLGLTTPRT